MTNYQIALYNWLHVLATIMMVGYYVFIDLINLPILKRLLRAIALSDLIGQVSTRLRPYF